jgi:hypothetical protein
MEMARVWVVVIRVCINWVKLARDRGPDVWVWVGVEVWSMLRIGILNIGAVRSCGATGPGAGELGWVVMAEAGRRQSTAIISLACWGFNEDQGFVASFLNVTVKTMRAGLSDTRCPITVVLDEMIVLIPNSLISVSRSWTSHNGLNLN